MNDNKNSMNVFAIQAFVMHLDGPELTLDGIWGNETRNGVRKMLEDAGEHSVSVDGSWLVAGEQYIMREMASLKVGPIDGLVGPATLKARTLWRNGEWRAPLMAAHDADSRMPDALRRWPKQSEMSEFYGEPGTNIVMVNSAYPLRLAWDTNTTVSRFQCNAKVAESILNVQRAHLKSYGYEKLQALEIDLFGGCFNNRPMRGGTKPSTHAYGAAWDTNPLDNSLHAKRENAQLSRPEYDEYWNAWTAEGWLSLGKARNFDWMHTQAARLG